MLTFPLSGLPSTVNQDVKISIALPSGETNALPRLLGAVWVYGDKERVGPQGRRWSSGGG